MKKKFVLILTVLLLCCNTVFADITVKVDGNNVSFDQAPVIESGRTLVPLRAIFEALGAKVGWDGSTVSAKIGDTDIAISIGSNELFKNGIAFALEVPAKIISDRTFVPVRAISEAFGCNVLWNKESMTVSISTASGLLKVHYIDVGQGDSEFIQFPDGKNMLIDAGENGDTVVSYLNSIGVTSIDYCIATHPHVDHIGGMDEVLETYNIGLFYLPAKQSSTQTYYNMLDALVTRACTIASPSAGAEIYKSSGAKATCIAPVKTYDNVNDSSTVVKVEYKNCSFLFEGDAEQQAEADILSSGANVKADILKVGHHGSKTSSSTEYISAVQPLYSIISCGSGNSYRHPHSKTLSTLTNAGSKILRTDEMGTIVVTTDGYEYSIQ